jgi:hypothetical protein
MLGCLGGVVLWSINEVVLSSVGCNVVNWSLGLTCSTPVPAWCTTPVPAWCSASVPAWCSTTVPALLFRKEAAWCEAWGRKILRSFCVIARTNINWGVILWSLGGVGLSVVSGCCVCCYSCPPYPGEIGTPVVDPAINDTTPNSSTPP